jgi:hypothetical protein
MVLCAHAASYRKHASHYVRKCTNCANSTGSRPPPLQGIQRWEHGQQLNLLLAGLIFVQDHG